jgi:hypothetical protein
MRITRILFVSARWRGRADGKQFSDDAKVPAAGVA